MMLNLIAMIDGLINIPAGCLARLAGSPAPAGKMPGNFARETASIRPMNLLGEPSEADLLARVAQGDEDAFSSL